MVYLLQLITTDVDVLQELHVYEKLQTFDFTSDRRRMSVIVKHSKSGEIKIVTKGADDVILPRLIKSTAAHC